MSDITNEQSRMRHYMWAAFACFLWSTAFVGIKIGLKYTTPQAFAGIRFMLSGIMLVFFCGNFFHYLKQVRIHAAEMIKISFFQTFLLYLLFYEGMQRLPASLGAVIIGASPLTAAVLSHFLMKNDRMNIKKIAALFTGISGVALATYFKTPVLPDGSGLFWVLVLVCGTLCSAYANIIAAQRPAGLHPYVLTSSQLFTGGAGLYILSLFTEGFSFPVFGTEYFVSLFWLAFVSAAAFAVWFRLLKTSGLTVSELNIWKFIIPVAGALLGCAVFETEQCDAGLMVSVGLVAGSIILYNRQISIFQK